MTDQLPFSSTLNSNGETMEINEYQRKVDEWIREYGVRYFDEKTNGLILMEEVGELARLMARIYGEQSFKREIDNKQALENEVGDIFFVLTCLANQMNMDLEQVIKDNFSKKTDRDNQRHFKNPKLRE